MVVGGGMGQGGRGCGGGCAREGGEEMVAEGTGSRKGEKERVQAAGRKGGKEIEGE